VKTASFISKAGIRDGCTRAAEGRGRFEVGPAEFPVRLIKEGVRLRIFRPPVGREYDLYNRSRGCFLQRPDRKQETTPYELK
jgi:hypothetical protein